VTGVAMHDRRVVVVSSRLWPGFNDLWDAVEPEVGALAVVGARSADDAGAGERERIALRSVGLRRGTVWQHVVGLRRHLRSLRPDLVHVNRELWAVVAQEVVGLDTAVVVHGAENLWLHGGRVEQLLRRRLVDRAVRRLGGYASWNRAGADHVVRRRRELGLGPVPTLVLPAVVPPAPFRAVTWQGPETPGVLESLEILLVGRAVPEKGFHDVLDAAAGVPGARVTLCGEGPVLDDLRRTADRRGVPLTARGKVEPTELAELMARSHVLVQPSRTTASWAEQFGRTVAEAMTVGLPCLVSDSGELPHLVEGDPEAVFPEGDGAALRERLLRLGEGSGLRDLASRQGPLAAQWEPRRAGAAVLGFWRQVLA
jgi:glycosyltransferase involved in cell wall biosynthesis